LSDLTKKPQIFFNPRPRLPGSPFQLRMTQKPRTFFNTRLPGSPFFRVREPNSNSGGSIAEQYEYIVLETH